MLRYPLGWMTVEGGPYNEPTGKRVRPILLLMCADAAGGDVHKALSAAAAVELLHNFSLIHDDIQDNSPLRHGRDTVWRVWGVANAINAGDAMFTLSFAAIQRLAVTGSSAEITLRALELFTKTALALTRGQHLDMRFERQANVSVEQYIEMISGKTAALLGLCAQLGALIASCDDERAAYFGRFGVDLGIAFQIHDDILGIWGDEARTGKSAASDILSRKKSLPVLYGLEQSPRLAEIYAQPTDTPIDVAEVTGLLNEVGAQEYARDLEQEYSAKSAAALAAANPEPKAAAALRALIDALFDRRS
jgi:geranylgeranyl diphosphate synthase type I